MEDSYDIEGMAEAAKQHSGLSEKLTKMFTEDSFKRILHLGAGGCHVCRDCAISSLEAYGINVSKLAVASGMKYINGQNTVTYFGAFFCSVM